MVDGQFVFVIISELGFFKDLSLYSVSVSS